MAEHVTYPRNGYPLSEAELRLKMGNNPLFEWLRFYSRDRIHFFEDFLTTAAGTESTDLLDQFTTATGATATVFTHAAHQSGIINGVSGTTAATSGLQLYTPAIWSGDLYAGCEVRLRTSVITEQELSVGFASTLPAVNTNVINSLATPTFNTTANGAMYVQNHATATTTSGLYTIGTAITAAKTATTTHRLVADTFSTIRIQLVVNQVFMWINGQLVVSHNTAGTNYIEGGTLASFFISSKRSDTTDSTVHVDYIRLWQARL
jgi:hypothetical protein